MWTEDRWLKSRSTTQCVIFSPNCQHQHANWSNLVLIIIIQSQNLPFVSFGKLHMLTHQHIHCWLLWEATIISTLKEKIYHSSKVILNDAGQSWCFVSQRVMNLQITHINQLSLTSTAILCYLLLLLLYSVIYRRKECPKEAGHRAGESENREVVGVWPKLFSLRAANGRSQG